MPGGEGSILLRPVRGSCRAEMLPRTSERQHGCATRQGMYVIQNPSILLPRPPPPRQILQVVFWVVSLWGGRGVWFQDWDARCICGREQHTWHASLLWSRVGAVLQCCPVPPCFASLPRPSLVFTVPLEFRNSRLLLPTSLNASNCNVPSPSDQHALV